MASKNPVLNPSHPAIKEYYAALKAFSDQNIRHEGAVSAAFESLLTDLAKRRNWLFVPLLSIKTGNRIVPDGTLRDLNGLPRGYWEAKDTDDDLDKEIARKKAAGYPLTNIIFEDTREAVLYQDGKERLRTDLAKPDELVRLLLQYFAYTEPDIEGFERAVDEFSERVPELAKGLLEKIRDAKRNNDKFVAAFDAFLDLCRTSIDPKLPVLAVEEMLVQHLLTERLFRTIFDNPDFTQRNVIAAEVERVIDALVSRSFSRRDYLKSLDPFYLAIESAARNLPEFADKQHFLNTVYERFFQGYSTRVADTHGIVYTPQPIVDFMVASVEKALKEDFAASFGSAGVTVLDPCTGTGNFIVNILRRTPRRQLGSFYRDHLFANEIMLLPYYIAALNIEHTHYELAGAYEPFEGLCFVDTLDLAESRQGGFSFLTEANTQRVQRQRKAPITVIIGNPPYNMGQKSENENNRNRSYKIVDERIRDTYSKDSSATLKNKLYDPYVRFFRWAVDRLGDKPGIICFVSNNSFIEHDAFDGMQKHLLRDFSRVYHIDLHGNVHKDRTLSGTQHNVFGVQVGIGITIAIRRADKRSDDHSLRVYTVPERWTRTQKLAWLAAQRDYSSIEFQSLPPHRWLEFANSAAFTAMFPLGSKEAKAAKRTVGDEHAPAVFKSYTVGVLTARDDIAYDFQRPALKKKIVSFIDAYNREVDRYKRARAQNKRKIDIDRFVDTKALKWTHNLKQALRMTEDLTFQENALRRSLYRPFCKKWLYFDRSLNERVYLTPRLFPTVAAERENVVICCTIHTQMPFLCLATNVTPNEAVGGRNGQCFPFYTYSEDGSSRSENISDATLQRFRKHYADTTIDKWDIFRYVYAMLHHPEYRTQFAANLQREIPRVPFVSEFRSIAAAGAELLTAHLGYEDIEPFTLGWKESSRAPLSCLVNGRMRLDRDNGTVVVNESLQLTGIPQEAFEYVLGTRSALEWVVDQHKREEEAETGRVSDPNDPKDDESVVRLIERVTAVSLKTVQVTKSLPSLSFA